MQRRGRVRSARAAAVAIGVLTWDAGLALACQGPGAMAAIERAERSALWLWATALVIASCPLLVGAVRTRGWRRYWPFALLLFIHPGWWMGARGGDCGKMLMMSSTAMTALTAASALLATWRAVRRARSQGQDDSLRS